MTGMLWWSLLIRTHPPMRRKNSTLANLFPPKLVCTGIQNKITKAQISVPLFGSNLHAFRIFSRNQSLFRRKQFWWNLPAPGLIYWKTWWKLMTSPPSQRRTEAETEDGWSGGHWTHEGRGREGRPPTQDSPESFISFDMFLHLDICWPVFKLTHPSTQLESHLLPVINPSSSPTPHLHTCPPQTGGISARLPHSSSHNDGFPINNAFPGL